MCPQEGTQAGKRTGRHALWGEAGYTGLSELERSRPTGSLRAPAASRAGYHTDARRQQETSFTISYGSRANWMWRSCPQKHQFGGTTFWFIAQLSHGVRPLMSGADIAKQTSSPIEQGVLSTFCHQEIFFRVPSLPHLHPLRPLPKKGSGCHWWSVKCLLCHQRLWGKNTCMICPGYITWAAKIESVCVILCLNEKISNFLPETISLTEHVDSEAGSTHHLPQTEGGFHFFWI